MIGERAQLRLWAKVRLPTTADGCLVWMGKTDGNGAPEFYIDARRGHHKLGKARRILYAMCVRELPRSVELSPECDEPMCIRPDHMTEYGQGWGNPYRRQEFIDAIQRRSKT
jgi:hypothetical protein